MKLELFRQIFKKKVQIPNFIKMLPVRAELFNAEGETDRQTEGRSDRRTDVTEVIVAFRNFANAPKNRHHNRKP
jgi:hypothetical protein